MPVGVVLFLALAVLPYPLWAQSRYSDFTVEYRDISDDTFPEAHVVALSGNFGKLHEYWDYDVTVAYWQVMDGSASASGPGDVVLSTGYRWKLNSTATRRLRLHSTIKLPYLSSTAIGTTGELDAGLFLSYMQIDPTLGWIVSVGYTVTGDSASVIYHDIWSVGLGLTRYLDPGFLSMMIEQRGNLLPGQAAPLDVAVSYSWPGVSQQFFRLSLRINLTSERYNPVLGIGVMRWY